MKTVFALGCHPDDIEFTMAGVLFLLKAKGCRIHYMNIANGSCGTTALSRKEITGIRRQEAMTAAKILGADFHGSLCNDIEVYYEDKLIRKVAAVVREIRPDIMFVPSPVDYMEDHVNTGRIGVTAAFVRGMRNYDTIPKRPPFPADVVLYHALPYGLKDGLGNTVRPKIFVDIAVVMEKKSEMLAAHKSQKEWLDKSQGLDSYVSTMKDMAGAVGKMSGKFELAEGFTRHSHLGFSAGEDDPLTDLLKENVLAV